MKILIASFNSWHMDNAAKAYELRGELSGLFIGNANTKNITKDKYKRCWSYALAMHPIFKFHNKNYEFWQYSIFMTLYNGWLKKQHVKNIDVVQAIAWGAKAPFDLAEKLGAKKVIDMPNSYPTTYDAIERREMALWGSKVKPAIPAHIIKQVTRDIERADLVLCPSKWVYDSMLSNGIPKSKCAINHFGVNIDSFIERNKIPKKPRFVITGSIRLRKGHQYLFLAFSKLLEIYSDAELVVVGDVHKDFEQLWKARSVPLTHYKSLTHKELSDLYQTCTAFVLPSLEEGFARVLIEAMASGLPIITTYESGATTLISNGLEGLIVRSRSVSEITDAMIFLIKNPEENLKLGERAAEKGRIKNTWQDYGDRNIEIFKKILIS
jgi:glycosyltransferase involved in cell wall biosynthesis